MNAYMVWPSGVDFDNIEDAVAHADTIARELDDSVKVEVTHSGILSYTTTGHNRELSAARRKAEKAAQAASLAEELGRFVNGMDRESSDAFATALANQHPTLLGQVAKAVGIATIRRVMYDPEWRPYDKVSPIGNPCGNFGGLIDVADGKTFQLPMHRAHDGRIDCTTVIGAELLARQSYI